MVPSSAYHWFNIRLHLRLIVRTRGCTAKEKRSMLAGSPCCKPWRLLISAGGHTIHFVRASRAMYYATRDEAQFRPDRTISLIVNGADQVKYALPHFASKSKASSIGLGIPIHLIGVLNHGGNSAVAGAFLFTANDYNLTGSNIVADVIHRVITSERPRLQALDLILPPVLFV